MTWLDITLIVILVGLAFWGWRTGFVRGAILVAGLVVGIYLAGRLAAPVGERLTFIQDPGAARFAGFALVVLASLVVAGVVGGVLRRLLRLLFVGWVDNLLGAAANLLAGLLVLTAIIVALGSFFPGATGGLIRGSPVARFLADNTPLVLSILPQDYRRFITRVARPAEPSLEVMSLDLQPAGPVTLALKVYNPNPYGGTLDGVTAQVYYETDGGGRYPLTSTDGSPGTRLKADSAALVIVVLEPVGEAQRAALESAAGPDGRVRVGVEGEARVNLAEKVFALPFSGSAVWQVR